jgi:arsenate reductase (glutaredoxin)
MPDTPLVQVFGFEGDQATRAAQRFFKERRVAISFVDLRKRSLAPAELRRFADRLGVTALLDTAGKQYQHAGLAYIRLDDREMFERLLDDPRLLRLPLVRYENEVAVGRDETAWKGFMTRPGDGR